ncbi:MAG: hypothetical protein MJE66_13810 [Proteobacteria bacterium]|nr:hypothetical protein [Pseudomonadota bacterium]
MRRPTPRRRRLSARLTAAAPFAVLGAALLLALAWGMGWGPFSEAPKSFQQPEGTVAVPISPRPIAAYKRLGLEDLIDPRTGRPAYVFLAPENVREEMKVELKTIVGRVLRKEKPAGFAFTERDFAPPGTPPGLSAGIPPGKRAMRLDISKVPGLEELRQGDRFDLISTIPLDGAGLDEDAIGGIRRADALFLDPSLANWTKQATVEVIVQNGVLVESVKTRTMPISVSTLTSGQVTRTRPVQEVVVAIDPLEVAPLTQAIATDAELRSVIRSGHPDDPSDSVTPGARPRSPLQSLPDDSGTNQGAGYRMVEAIDGTGRRYIAVRSAPQQPPVANPEVTVEAFADAPSGNPVPNLAAPPPGWSAAPPETLADAPADAPLPDVAAPPPGWSPEPRP